MFCIKDYSLKIIWQKLGQMWIETYMDMIETYTNTIETDTNTIETYTNTIETYTDISVRILHKYALVRKIFASRISLNPCPAG